MLTLKLYPSEFAVLIDYLHCHLQNQKYVALSGQPVAMLVLIDFLDRFKVHRLLSWSRKRPNREYVLNMAPTVAKALYEEMQYSMLTPYQQTLLAKLDQAIVNYQNPHAQPYTIGNLVVYGSVR